MRYVLLVIEAADYREASVHGPFDTQDEAETHAADLGFIEDEDGDLILPESIGDTVAVVRALLEP